MPDVTFINKTGRTIYLIMGAGEGDCPNKPTYSNAELYPDETTFASAGNWALCYDWDFNFTPDNPKWKRAIPGQVVTIR